jgi:hypothetical protein
MVSKGLSVALIPVRVGLDSFTVSCYHSNMAKVLQFPIALNPTDEFDTTELEQDVLTMLEKFTPESIVLMLYKLTDYAILEPSVRKIILDNPNV